MAEALNNINIVYTYHQHTGSSSLGTGCYTIKQTHQHIQTCFPAVKCDKNEGLKDPSKPEDVRYIWSGTCSNGHKVQIVLDGSSENLNGGIGYCTTCQPLCGLSTSTTYSLGCGKTENTIESATIVFD